jgi:hypothetical protein
MFRYLESRDRGNYRKQLPKLPRLPKVPKLKSCIAIRPFTTIQSRYIRSANPAGAEAQTSGGLNAALRGRSSTDRDTVFWNDDNRTLLGLSSNFGDFGNSGNRGNS